MARSTLLAASLAIVGVTLVRGQTINPSAQMILKTDRPLLPAEIARVLDAAREDFAFFEAYFSNYIIGAGEPNAFILRLRQIGT